MYTFVRDTAWSVRKVYFKASASAFAAAEPIKPPTKLSAMLTELNANTVDALTTALVTELSHKLRLAEDTSDAQAEIIPGS